MSKGRWTLEDYLLFFVIRISVLIQPLLLISALFESQSYSSCHINVPLLLIRSKNMTFSPFLQLSPKFLGSGLE